MGERVTGWTTQGTATAATMSLCVCIVLCIELFVIVTSNCILVSEVSQTNVSTGRHVNSGKPHPLN